MTQKPLKLLLLNCYPQKSREKFDRDGVAQPHDLFMRMLRRRAPKASWDLIFPADPECKMPPGSALSDYDGVIWTGSDLTAYHHDDARVTRMIEFAKEGFARGMKSYGSCWGLQIAAAASGGEVRRMPKGREWGVAPVIELTEAGQASEMHRGKPKRFSGFVMHLDEVGRMPPGAAVLSGNSHCAVHSAQVRYAKGSFWGTQFHCEYDLLEMSRLVAARAAPLIKEGFFKDPAGVAQFAAQMAELHAAPNDEKLRKILGADETLLDQDLRELEFTNWLGTL